MEALVNIGPYEKPGFLQAIKSYVITAILQKVEEYAPMPGSKPTRKAVSKAQQRYMGAELARKRAGKSTQTDMSEAQLEEYASTKHKGLPARKKAKK